MRFRYAGPFIKEKKMFKDLSDEQKIEFADTFIKNGKFVETGTKEEDVDPKELEMGILVEYEHSGGKTEMAKEIAKRIALDHLSEISDYYTRLKEMEATAKKEGSTIEKLAEEIEIQTKSTNWKMGTCFPG